MTNLAYIQKIIDIQPIPNADKIEHIFISGWWCVAAKGKFKKGDWAGYIQIDSIVPDIPEFSYMEASGYRVRTRKFRGALSQGLVLTIDEIKAICSRLGTEFTDDMLTPKTNITHILGIKKYEKPLPPSTRRNTNPAGRFPEFLNKTDEERIQNVPEILTEWSGLMCEATYKMDGTSATYFLRDGELVACSRNLELKPDDNLYYNAAEMYKVKEVLKYLEDIYNSPICIQGELVTSRINNKRNPLNLSHKDIRLFVFNVYKYGRIIEYIPVRDIGAALYLPLAPLHSVFRWNFKSMDEVLKYAEVNYPGTNFMAEGLVIRPLDNKAYNRNLPNGLASIKVLNNKYLLKMGE